MAYIYKITNKINGKCYIGETKQYDYRKRWRKHKDYGGCPILDSAFKKYGLKNFTFEILIICFDENRFSIEKEYIKRYNSVSPNGYNIKEGSDTGMSHTDKSKEKISESLKKYYKTEDSKSKAKVNVESHRKAMAKAVGTKVAQYDLDGNFIAAYSSVAEAARQVSSIKSKTSIQDCIHQRTKTGLGYVWKIIE